MSSKKYDEAVKTYTPAQLSKYKAAAKKYYQDNNGEVSVKVLARVAKVPQGYIRQWMKEEDWDESFMEDKGDKVILSDKTKEVLRSGNEYGLNEQEELFCYHYLKTFNATTSAIRAGYSSSFGHNKAYNLLKDDRIKSYLRDIKEQRNAELFIDGMRIVQEYIRIAFADITDFVKFGPGGISLRPSHSVDGQLISKVSDGKNGPSIELHDKMKALEKLEQYLDVMPDTWKRAMEERKVQLNEEKVKLLKQQLGDKEGNGKVTVNIVDSI